jgi:diacylglycerol kinase (ATP)
MSKITFIIHGRNKHRDKLVASLGQVFNEPSFAADFQFTKHPLHATILAREAALNGSQYIIGACGDGTFNEIVNGVMQSERKDVCLGLLPHGTGNDFSRTIKVDNDPAALLKLIESGKTRLIDVGLVHYKSPDGKDAQRYFNNITDIGIGGIIAHKMAGSTKRFGAFLTFQWAIVTTFFQFRHQVARIKAPGFSYEGKILSCIAANGRYFGAGLGIAPDARPDDGLLEIVLGAEISLWDYLKNLGQIRKCIKLVHPQMKYFAAREIEIETPNGKMPIDMDGEFIGYSPMRVTLLHQALRVLTPA